MSVGCKGFFGYDLGNDVLFKSEQFVHTKNWTCLTKSYVILTKENFYCLKRGIHSTPSNINQWLSNDCSFN